MRRLLTLCVLVSGALFSPGLLAQQPAAAPQQAAPAAPAGDPIFPIRWMTGTWTSQVMPPNAQKAMTVEQKFTMVLNGRVLAFTTSFDGTMQYQGLFAYDAAKKCVVFWYPSADGELTRGTLTPQQDSLLLDFEVTDASGKVTPYQVRIHQTGGDGYDWTLFNKDGSGWKQLTALHYKRTAE
jgi:Protein of unknown function (DUF1579)